MVWVLVFKQGEKVVENTTCGFVILVNISVAKKLHNHSKVLFLGWGFIVEIEYKSQQEH